VIEELRHAECCLGRDTLRVWKGLRLCEQQSVGLRTFAMDGMGYKLRVIRS
jgi:hypothetical protein